MVAIANSDLRGANWSMKKGTICKVKNGKITYNGAKLCDSGSLMAFDNFLIIEEDLLNKIVENMRGEML